MIPVSYTHLDVYKRQLLNRTCNCLEASVCRLNIFCLLRYRLYTSSNQIRCVIGKICHTLQKLCDAIDGTSCIICQLPDFICNYGKSTSLFSGTCCLNARI